MPASLLRAAGPRRLVLDRETLRRLSDAPVPGGARGLLGDSEQCDTLGRDCTSYYACATQTQ